MGAKFAEEQIFLREQLTNDEDIEERSNIG
jgi:hypothetical protein